MDTCKTSLKITGLKQGVKNPNRVNVYVNDKYAFSLDMAQVVDLGVKVGRVLSDTEYSELKHASEFGKAYQRALEWALVRPRSVRELRDYLKRRGVRGEMEKHNYDNLIVQRLCEKGYINDEVFARWYVENRFVKKGVSRKRLKMELMKKGISHETIVAIIVARDDEEEVKKIILRKRVKYDDEKLMAYLVRQGFSYELVKKVLDED